MNTSTKGTIWSRAVGLVIALSLISNAWSTTSANAVESESADRRPNILIIVTDDQPLGTLDAMPKTRKWFGDGGVTFTNAFVTTPLCCPSRSSIMTGRYAHNHEVTGNEGQSSRLVQTTTLQHHLDSAGYNTAFVGKFLNGWSLHTPPKYFDRFAMFHPGPISPVHGYYNSSFNVNGQITHVPSYSTHFMAEKAKDFLRDFEGNDARPWYMYVAPWASHKPFVAEPRYADVPVPAWQPGPSVAEKDLSDKPPWVEKKKGTVESGRAKRTAQMRTLMSVDDLVGGIKRQLGRLDETRDTLAIFISDNGYLWSHHRVQGKSYPYTESVQVPFMLRWPGKVKAGSSDYRLVANIDIAPTLLEAAGVAVPTWTVDGQSLFGSETRQVLLMEYWSSGRPPTWKSVRTMSYQYIEYYNQKGERIFREYYDLRADPWQLENLFDDGQVPHKVADQVESLLKSVRDCVGAQCP